MSEAVVSGVRVNYEIVGKGPTVLLLHGWGGCIGSMAPIRDSLKRSYRVITVDLPGFGLSERPPAVWGSAEYGAAIAELLRETDTPQTVAVIGHSFGGKVAIRLALANPGITRSLVLVGTPGVRLPLSPKAARRVATVKRARAVAPHLPGPLRRWLEGRLITLGSEDYRNAGEMRPILVKTVNEDLREVLPGIAVPTLLVWGALDDAAPLEIGRQMEQLIRGAGLVVLEKSGHFPYLDEPGAFAAVLASFLTSMRGPAS